MRALVTSAAGDRLAALPVSSASSLDDGAARVVVHLDQPRQRLHGVGGSLTQASASALSRITPHKRQEVLRSLFSPARAAYSLVRTHIGSCDFSTHSYVYVEDSDPNLSSFSVSADADNGLLDLIHDAQAVAGAAFRIIASPWTAPPWMKDNARLFEPEARRGGTLLPEHHDTFARYVSAYVSAYAERGIPIWAVTPVNEPHGNQGTWESMEMSPQQQAAYVQVLGRTLQADGHDVEILIYDQNRAGVVDFAAPILTDQHAVPWVFGTAVHWYDSTFRVYEDQLEALHALAPDRPIIQSEGCIDNVFGKGQDRGPDAPTPWWRDDGWYWRKEATDWGWDWLDDTRDHPPYAPAFRYARDLVGCFAHHVTGWVDWNVVLDRHGGPNHVGNFCLAPILVDAETDFVYYTPLHSILEQVSRYTRPGAVVRHTEVHGAPQLWASAHVNPDGCHVVHLFNESEHDVPCHVALGNESFGITLPTASIVTLIHRPMEKPMSSRPPQGSSLIDGGYVPSGVLQFTDLTPDERLRRLRELLERGIHGLCFSAYEAGQAPSDHLHLSEAQVGRRIDVIAPHTRWVRTFSCTEGNQHGARLARDRGIRSLAGAWIGDEPERDEAELEGLVALARDGAADLLAVGNEVLLRGERTVEELVALIQRVKAEVGDRPVGYVDAYFQFVNHPELVEACDFLPINCYPFWEKCPLEHSVGYVGEMVRQVQAVSQGKPVVIAETGWPSAGSAEGAAVPGLDNMVLYALNLIPWAEAAGVPLFWFSAFDEAWKVGAEGDCGAYWGLWDAQGELKIGE